MVNFLDTLWVVDAIIIDEKTYKKGDFYLNLLLIKSNGSCRMPKIEADIGGKANWDIRREKNEVFIISFTNAAQHEFNAEYEIFIDMIKPIKKIRLKSKNITFFCSASNYP